MSLNKIKKMSKMVFEQGKLYERLKWEAKIEKIKESVKKHGFNYTSATGSISCKFLIDKFIEEVDKIVEEQK